MTRPCACEELAFAILVRGLRLQGKSILPPGTSLTGSGPTLVFLHEGLGSITQWRNYPLALANATGLPALVFDRAGFGRSEPRPRPQDPSYLEEEAEAWLPAVLAACGIERPLLVGHSDGATIALLYAAGPAPGLVGVVSEAAHVFVEDRTIQGIWRALRQYESTALRERLRAHHGAKVDGLFREWSEVWLSTAFRDWTMAARLPSVRCPVLAIQGEDDEYGTAEQVRAIVERVAGPARGLMLPGCAHVPHFQARDRVLAASIDFIQAAVKAGFAPESRAGR